MIDLELLELLAGEDVLRIKAKGRSLSRWTLQALHVWKQKNKNGTPADLTHDLQQWLDANEPGGAGGGVHH